MESEIRRRGEKISMSRSQTRPRLLGEGRGPPPSLEKPTIGALKSR